MLSVSAGAQGKKDAADAPPTPPVAPVPHRPLMLPARRLDFKDKIKLDSRSWSTSTPTSAGWRSRRRVRPGKLSREATQQAVEASREALAGLRLDGLRGLDALGDLRGSLFSGRMDARPRYQGDPADSLYQRAYQLLSSSDYRAAAQRFKEVQQKFPNTQYLARAMYYQAFALYRAGSDQELREALTVLDQQQQKFPNARVVRGSDSPSDAAALATRIRGALAMRGDAAARQQLNQAASAGAQSCDREDQTVRSRGALGAHAGRSRAHGVAAARFTGLCGHRPHFHLRSRAWEA